MRLKAITSASVMALVLGLTGPATATAQQSYSLADFDGKAVHTAEDMVRHIPNFVITGSNSNGNILIDGQRPGEGLNDALRRVPASMVEHIERLPAGTGNYDFQGHTELINIVRKPTDKPMITLNYGGNIYTGGRVKPQFGMTWLKKKAGRTLEASLNYFQNNDDGTGRGEKYTTYADGTQKQHITESRGNSEGLEARVKWAGNAYGGQMSLEGKMRPQVSGFDADYSGETFESEARKTENLNSEFSGSYNRDVVKNLNLRFDLWARENRNQYERDYKTPSYTSAYTEDKLTAEGNFSGQATWRKSPALTLQAGAEHRYNVFDSESLSTGSWMTPDDIVTPGMVHGEENRGKLYISSNWRPADNLTVDSGLMIETADIYHHGTYSARENYSYARPRLSLNWRADDHLQLRISREREVGGLGYWDFVSVAQWQYEKPEQLLSPVDLVPYRQWADRFSLDYRFADKGQLVINYQQFQIKDAIERVPVYAEDAVHDAVGNIGDGENQSLSTRLSLPTDGLLTDEGGMVHFNATWSDSEVTDPVTGEKRRISGQTPLSLSLNFSQDKTLYSWGWSVDKGWDNTTWRYDQVSRSLGSPWVSLYAEYRPNPKLAIRGELQNLGSRTSGYEVTRYEGLRGLSEVAYHETSVRDSEPRLYLRIRNEL